MASVTGFRRSPLVLTVALLGLSTILWSVPMAAGDPSRVTLPYADMLPGATDWLPITLIDDVTGLGIQSIDIRFEFDNTFVTVLEARRGPVIEDWSLFAWNETPPGTIRLATAHYEDLAGSGVLAEVRFAIDLTAPCGGESPLQFTKLSFNEGGQESDPIDGTILFIGASSVNATTWARVKALYR